LGATLRSNFGVDGSAIDFRIRYDLTDPSDVGGGVVETSLCLFDQPDECDSVSGDYYFSTQGVYYQFTTPGSGPTQLDAVKRIGGILTGIGTTSSPTCQPCWLRIAKSGTVFTFYYSTNGSTWVQDEQQDITALTASTWYLHFTIATNSVFSGSWAVEADHYSLTAGGMVQGFRKIGSWYTPAFLYTGEVAHNITVDYAGVSADTYIDSVAVVDANSGLVLWENTTNIISGTTVFYALDTETPLLGHDFQVRVTLAGDGESSASIRLVTLSTVRAAALVFLDRTIDVAWLILFAMVLAAIFSAAWYVKEWRDV